MIKFYNNLYPVLFLIFLFATVSCKEENKSEPKVKILFPQDSVSLFSNTSYSFEAEIISENEVKQIKFEITSSDNNLNKWKRILIGNVEGTYFTQNLSVNIPNLDSAYGWYDVKFSAVDKNGTSSEILQHKFQIKSDIDTIKPTINIQSTNLPDTLLSENTYFLAVQVNDVLNDLSIGTIRSIRLEIKNQTIIFEREEIGETISPLNKNFEIILPSNIIEGNYEIKIIAIDVNRNISEKSIYRTIKN
jgi:hypothetical protein